MSEFLIFINGLLFATSACLLAFCYRQSIAATAAKELLTNDLKSLLEEINKSHNQLTLNQVEFNSSLAEIRQGQASLEHKFGGSSSPFKRGGIV